MFGATAVRQKRERERREKVSRGLEPQALPYIKPFGPRFDRNELPYFKYRELKLIHEETGNRLAAATGPWEVGGLGRIIGTLGIELFIDFSDPKMCHNTPVYIDRIGN